MNRLAAIQACPLFFVRASTPTLAARSRGASSRTTKGSLPPSSRTDGLRCLPAVSATALPARTLPVRVTARTRSSAMASWTASGSTTSVWKTPSGMPTLWRTSSMAFAQPVTLGACLRSIVFPAASVGAATRSTCQILLMPTIDPSEKRSVSPFNSNLNTASIRAETTAYLNLFLAEPPDLQQFIRPELN